LDLDLDCHQNGSLIQFGIETMPDHITASHTPQPESLMIYSVLTNLFFNSLPCVIKNLRSFRYFRPFLKRLHPVEGGLNENNADGTFVENSFNSHLKKTHAYLFQLKEEGWRGAKSGARGLI
jgi:hypothetical protein